MAGALPVAADLNDLMRACSLVTRSLALNELTFLEIGCLMKVADCVTGDALTSDATEAAKAS